MRLSIVALLALSIPLAAQQPVATPPARAQVVMLGTGTPNPDPDRSGPATAIVVNGSVYLVDCDPGIVRRVTAANRKGIAALTMPNLKMVFLTHLHSDHTLGLPDLIFSPWVMERTALLKVFGPAGTKKMVRNIEAAWAEDIDMRLNGGEPANKTGSKADATELKPGVVYEDANVTVTAFPVLHGSWKQAFGYRFDTRINSKPDRSIVISGDTTYTATIAEACKGCDVLIHEVYSQPALEKRKPEWRAYHSRFHTSSADLARIATQAKPGLLVLYHQLFWTTSEEDLVKEIQKGYSGKVVSAHDLDVY
ncbi:MAG TPA: MBL fold metallo-hydrolase [Terriglobales bacterium]|nr:MBL fold metallo-hydrolase [Terriglobales bacterium]